ncbi:MAG: beta-lactamase family protein [Actinomycetota bacterium]|nr:beta-lactamase family protein [Actinomycetota bacterium]
MPEHLKSRLEKLGGRGHRALVAGISRGGERVSCGWSAAGGEPDASTLFEIGSITKTFTGVLLADMHLRGEVSLEDPLSTYLPAPRPAWRHREPTLLELATHRSALPNTPGQMGRRELAYSLGLGRTDPWAAVTDADYARLVTRESPRRAPGGRMGYSSMAVGLLGDALAARAGTSYEELLTRRILTPLGMSATAITIRPEWSGKLIGGHSRRGRPRPPIEDFMPAAGSLRSNAEDMLRFLTACLVAPAQSPGPALALAQQPRARLAKHLEVGLCWMISTSDGAPKVLWHNGGTWGFRSFAGFAPERGTAAVLMSNTARSVDRLGFELVQGMPQPVVGSSDT